MSYRIHVTTADSVAIQRDTAANLADNLGFELDDLDDPNQAYLVFNDMGNQEAWVMPEDREALRRFAERILSYLSD